MRNNLGQLESCIFMNDLHNKDFLGAFDNDPLLIPIEKLVWGFIVNF